MSAPTTSLDGAEGNVTQTVDRLAQRIVSFSKGLAILKEAAGASLPGSYSEEILTSTYLF
jgi:hypothetical protein